MLLKQADKTGKYFLEAGVIGESELADALARQRQSGGRLGSVLLEMGAITQQELLSVLARRLGVRGCMLRHGLIDPKVARLISKEEAERLKVLPLFKVRDRLTVAMTEPQSLPTIDRLAELTGCEINPVLALESAVAEFINKYLTEEVNVESFLVSLADSDVEVIEREAVDEGPITNLGKMIEGSPVINLVNLMILRAVQDGASDVHVEPDKKKTRIRYRIDGVLRELMSPPVGMHAAIASRIKIIGKMDIAEKRLPQEGRVHLVAEGREIDLRVSSMPTILGEKMVLRVLDPSKLHVRLSDLGFSEDQYESFHRMILRAHGLVLVTGPTGSGKTTTLYSAIDLLRSTERNIVTVEDPVEYQLSMINQIQVNEAVGLTFARALRSILRQDPDIIMVGEIRDEQTARVAIQAALTGHLVLSTLHTNDSPGAVVRLTQMGIEPYLITAALNGVVAQRLARTNCAGCEQAYVPPESAMRDAGWLRHTPGPFKKGAGCRLCHDSGFRGRSGIFEVMEIDDETRRLIHEEASEGRIRTHLATTKWRSLRDAGLELVKEGRSSLEEVLRVTHTQQSVQTRAERRAKQAED